jgi:adenosylcobinamide kinase/adenosylcobinamide-phosphate guanylyltransferase
MGRVVFITGGARSGKSSFALQMGAEFGGGKAFVATMSPVDEESRERIERHRAERGAGWDTFEETIEVPALLGRLSDAYDTVVLDCLTLWLSNLMHSGGDVEAEVEALVGAVEKLALGGGLIVVSNEVGMGIVPVNETARRFRDLAGMLNRRVAGVAGEVFLMVSGIPVRIKGGGK